MVVDEVKHRPRVMGLDRLEFYEVGGSQGLGWSNPFTRKGYGGGGGRRVLAHQHFLFRLLLIPLNPPPLHTH